MTNPDTQFLRGKNVCITGTFNGGTRNILVALLTKHGATVQSAVTGTTDVLMYGEKAGTKLTTAQRRGIECWDESRSWNALQGVDTEMHKGPEKPKVPYVMPESYGDF